MPNPQIRKSRERFFNLLSGAVRERVVKPLAPLNEGDPQWVPVLSYVSSASLQLFFSARVNHPEIKGAFLTDNPHDFYWQFLSQKIMESFADIFHGDSRLSQGPGHFSFFLEPQLGPLEHGLPKFGFWHTGILFSWNEPTPLESQLFKQRASTFTKELEPKWEYRPLAEGFFKKLTDWLFGHNQLARHHLMQTKMDESGNHFLAIVDVRTLRVGKKGKRSKDPCQALCEMAERLFMKDMMAWSTVWGEKGSLPVYPGLVLVAHPGRDPNFVKFGFLLQPTTPTPEEAQAFQFLAANFEPRQ